MQDTPAQSSDAKPPAKAKWWKFTPYWAEPIAKGHVPREEMQAQIRRIEDAHQTAKQRFELIVAVANGAALAACSSKVLDALTKAPSPESVALVRLLLPSVMFFLVGLMAVGMAAAARIFLMETRMSQLSAIVVSTPPGGVVPVTIKWADPTRFWLVWIPEYIAGGAFFNGVLWPLVDVITGAGGKGPWTW